VEPSPLNLSENKELKFDSNFFGLSTNSTGENVGYNNESRESENY